MKKIKTAVNAVLKTLYPDYPIYGADTVEGYEKPSFFVYITQTFSEFSANLVHKNVEVEIDFIQKEPDESAGMDFFNKMQQAFLKKLKVESRYLNLSNHSFEFTGNHANIPVFTFEIEYYESIEKETETAVLMEKLYMSNSLKKGE
ncbi:phage tail terminator family protein [Zhenpiania hominis]|uniref:Uncharacterized protein n=1 Tax=Zhenpiania hominis TaxID=2763644 RepID=A0A923NLF8_9FIRM|nr:hypothetical protein [Zhenpiania hominis]MBC6681318.1 hypothetical protein [Zhenpiania hominis]